MTGREASSKLRGHERKGETWEEREASEEVIGLVSEMPTPGLKLEEAERKARLG